MNPSFNAPPVQPALLAELPASLRAQLEALVQTVEIFSPSSFRFAGGELISLGSSAAQSLAALASQARSIDATAARAPLPPGMNGGQAPRTPVLYGHEVPPASPRALPAGNGAGVSSQALVEALWPIIYHHFYARTYQGALSHSLIAQGGALVGGTWNDVGFISRLSAANRSQTRWDPAWRVYQQGVNGALHVQKRDTCRLVMPGEYAFAGGPGRMPRVGDVVDLLVLRDSQSLQPGFYFVFGETLASDHDDAHLARVYFNARAEGMPWLIEAVTGAFNRYSVPFRMKCLSNPAAYDRTDSAVLYVSRRFFPMALRLLAASQEVLDHSLKPGVPLFSKELRAGLGAADDPGTAESFGQSRVRMVCQGLMDAWEGGLRSQEERLLAVARRFARQGLSLVRPYLNEGMSDVYQWPEHQAQPGRIDDKVAA